MAAKRKRQSLQRAMTKAAIRTAVYRFVNDLMDTAIDSVAEIVSGKESSKKKVVKK